MPLPAAGFSDGRSTAGGIVTRCYSPANIRLRLVRHSRRLECDDFVFSMSFVDLLRRQPKLKLKLLKCPVWIPVSVWEMWKDDECAQALFSRLQSIVEIIQRGCIDLTENVTYLLKVYHDAHLPLLNALFEAKENDFRHVWWGAVEKKIDPDNATVPCEENLPVLGSDMYSVWALDGVCTARAHNKLLRMLCNYLPRRGSRRRDTMQLDLDPEFETSLKNIFLCCLLGNYRHANLEQRPHTEFKPKPEPRPKLKPKPKPKLEFKPKPKQRTAPPNWADDETAYRLQTMRLLYTDMKPILKTHAIDVGYASREMMVWATREDSVLLQKVRSVMDFDMFSAQIIKIANTCIRATRGNATEESVNKVFRSRSPRAMYDYPENHIYTISKKLDDIVVNPHIMNRTKVESESKMDPRNKEKESKLKLTEQQQELLALLPGHPLSIPKLRVLGLCEEDLQTLATLDLVYPIRQSARLIRAYLITLQPSSLKILQHYVSLVYTRVRLQAHRMPKPVGNPVGNPVGVGDLETSRLVRFYLCLVCRGVATSTSDLKRIAQDACQIVLTGDATPSCGYCYSQQRIEPLYCIDLRKWLVTRLVPCEWAPRKRYSSKSTSVHLWPITYSVCSICTYACVVDHRRGQLGGKSTCAKCRNAKTMSAALEQREEDTPQVICFMGGHSIAPGEPYSEVSDGLYVCKAHRKGTISSMQWYQRECKTLEYKAARRPAK